MGFSTFIHFGQLSPVVSSAMGVPTLSGQAVTLLCGLLTLYVFWTITTYAKLRQFRGPLWTGISNWPHSLAMLRSNCHEWYAEVSKKHGANHLPGIFCALHLFLQLLFLQLTLSTRVRADCPCRASSADHFFPRSLDAREQQAGLQALRLVLQSCADRVPEGQCLQSDG